MKLLRRQNFTRILSSVERFCSISLNFQLSFAFETERHKQATNHG
jgi:hypothetical protein